jgi:hypothetical protein
VEGGRPPALPLTGLTLIQGHGVNEPAPGSRGAHGLPSRIDVELGEDVADMNVDGSVTDEELFGNLPVRHPFSDQQPRSALMSTRRTDSSCTPATRQSRRWRS